MYPISKDLLLVLTTNFVNKKTDIIDVLYGKDSIAKFYRTSKTTITFKPKKYMI